jgi:hypothetical protein
MVFSLGPKDDIAALYVGSRIFEFERFAECAKRLHLKSIVAADIHAAKHADEYRHGRSIAVVGSGITCPSDLGGIKRNTLTARVSLRELGEVQDATSTRG